MEMSRIWMRRARPHCFCLVLTKSAMASTLPTTSLSLPCSKPSLTLLFSPSRRPISKTTCSSYAPVVPVHGSDPAIANNNSNSNSSKVLLKGMKYAELENWVKSHGYRPGQALMLWKRLYGNNIWAHCVDELEGLNKDFRKMLGEFAELKALSLRDILTAADGTRKEVSDSIHFG